ncbi:putative baseplate assembly protein, partial [Synechococcus sp. CS-1325]|uniref:putative baseplate assembly protein n=1 Tax=Synechococcus sp. CS-1325 TaxID=2847979 RepID=UPI00223AD72E
GLTTRDDGDFTIALCDALATGLDVLTFYQERIANEDWLRTASERRSILELAGLIGYQLAPGVAASTWLAFTLQEAPGNPALAAAPVQIPLGTRVQSVPGPGEQAQSFETVEPIKARTEWNTIPIRTTCPWQPANGDTGLWLDGVGTGLQPGDTLLILDTEREHSSTSPRWDIRVLTAVDEERTRGRTRVGWAGGLAHFGSAQTQRAALDASVHVFRQRAGLFGHNAPDPRLIFKDKVPPITGQPASGIVTSDGTAWAGYALEGGQIDLDASYPRIRPGSWVALSATSANPPVGLYRAQSVSFPSRSAFGLSGKVTRVIADTGPKGLDPFRNAIPNTLVLAQSERLEVASSPLGFPLWGDRLALGRVEPDLVSGRALAVSGRHPRIRLRAGQPPVTMELSAGGSLTIHEGDSLRLTKAPEAWVGIGLRALTPPVFGQLLVQPGDTLLRLRLLDRDDREGRAERIAAAAIELAPAEPDDPMVQEVVIAADLTSAIDTGRDPDQTPGETGVPGPAVTFVTLAAALRHCYDRETVALNANVAPATHGETVQEILGSGDARLPNARFALRQAPLTYVSAETASGRRSTLELRANDLLWHPVHSLYGRGPTERVYALAIDDQGRTSLRFGDGVEGAHLPSGDHNVRATYRKGLGQAGNVAAGALTTLLSRPLGVAGATNPQAAGGGQDPEREATARGNAPLAVRTLDRAVSIRDYRDFARAFPGIAKAHALWIPHGPGRGVFLTLAGEQGAPVDKTNSLREAFRSFGDPLIPLRLESYHSARFRLRLALKLTADVDPALVLPLVEARLRTAFGFAARDFGQGLSVDEVAATAQAVAGVAAVQVALLQRSDQPSPAVQSPLFAAVPSPDGESVPLAAELLTLDPGSLTLELLP